MSLQAAPVVTYNQRAGAVTYNQRAGAGARRGASVQRSGTGAARRVCAATGAARLYSGWRGAARLCSGRRPAVALDLLILFIVLSLILHLI